MLFSYNSSILWETTPEREAAKILIGLTENARMLLPIHRRPGGYEVPGTAFARLPAETRAKLAGLKAEDIANVRVCDWF